MDTIIAESGVAKATFYKHFPAKDDLVLAYLDKVDEVWTGQLHAAAEAAGADPRDQLVGMFDALTTACRREGYRGCAFINAAAEAVPGTPVHDRTVAHKRRVLRLGAGAGGRCRRSRPRGPGAQPDPAARRGLASGSLDAGEERRDGEASAEALVRRRRCSSGPRPPDCRNRSLTKQTPNDTNGAGAGASRPSASATASASADVAPPAISWCRRCMVTAATSSRTRATPATTEATPTCSSTCVRPSPSSPGRSVARPASQAERVTQPGMPWSGSSS